MLTMMPYRSVLNSFFAPMFDEPHARELPRMRVDIREEEGAYRLSADLPGIDKNDLHVDVKDGVLTIAAERSVNAEENREGWLCRERRFGRMERAFNLEGVDENGITAAYENGVLTLTLPKAQPAPEDEVRHIAID